MQAVRRFYEAIWNAGDVSAISEVLAPDVRFRGSLGALSTGHAGFADYVRSVTEALGGYRCDIRSLVVQDDEAAARMLFSGIHRCPFLGFAPTGRRVAWDGAAFFRFAGLRIQEIWVLGDLQGLYRQLGAATGPG